MDETPVRVEAYAGGRYPERPRRVEWHGEMREVREIIRQWQEPHCLCFVLRIDGDTTLRLCYYFQNDSWSATELGGP